MGGFSLLVEMHREGPALQPAQQACFLGTSSASCQGPREGDAGDLLQEQPPPRLRKARGRGPRGGGPSSVYWTSLCANYI